MNQNKYNGWINNLGRVKPCFKIDGSRFSILLWCFKHNAFRHASLMVFSLIHQVFSCLLDTSWAYFFQSFCYHRIISSDFINLYTRHAAKVPLYASLREGYKSLHTSNVSFLLLLFYVSSFPAFIYVSFLIWIPIPPLIIALANHIV